MSANQQQKTHKMCKSPSKPIAKALPELGSYEVLNTNCTMVGSNNLHLDSKINSSISYPNPQIKVCSKPMKSPDNLLKKPQSPRGDFMVQTVNKFTSFNQLRNLQPSPTPNSSGFVQQSVRTSKTGQQTASFNNGLGMSPSPSAYSNPSPGSYPNAAVSPYNVQISSPANSVSSITSGAIKSPVPSPQNIRPPTPQPILPQAFPQLPTLSGQNLVQIIHAASQNSGPTAYANHQVLTQRTIIAPQSASQQQLPGAPLLKIKPPQNILPKPPSSNIGSNAGGPGGGKSSVGPRVGGGGAPGGVQGHLAGAPGLAGAQSVGQGMGQLVLPGQQVAGPALLLNQVPLLVGSSQLQGSGGVQLILRPGTPTAGGAGGKLGGGGAGAPQLVLQPGAPPSAPQVILQQPGHGQGQRSASGHTQHLHQVPQQLVRVLTANGMLQSLNPLGGLNALGPTYIMQQPQVQSLPQVQPTSQVQSLAQQAPTKPHYIQSQSVPQHQAGSVQQSGTVQQVVQGNVPQGVGMEQLPPPKKKPKKKKKNKEPKLDLANIMKLSGIGDDDDVMFESDASESAAPPEPTTSTNNPQQQKHPRPADSPHTQPTSDTNTLTTDFPKRIGNIHISALTQDNNAVLKQSRTDSHLGEKQTYGHSQISVQQSLSDINAINQNLAQIGLIGHQNQTNFLGSNHQILSHHNFQNNSSESQNIANILQALNQGQNLQNFSLLNGSGHITSVSQSFPNTSTCLPTSQYQKFPVLPTMSIAQTLTNSDLTGMSKSQPSGNYPQPTPKQTSAANPIHFNIPNAIPNIQVQNFCANNSNLILNQLNQSNILAPNIPNFSGNITINNSLIPNTNLTLPNNLMSNFLPANLVQPAQEMNAGFGSNVQRTGGFKLALSEDGRLILQHDPTLNQDIQSQLLLQSIFGINLQGGNLVLTSVNNTPSLPPPPKPVTISEAMKKPPQPLDHIQVHSTTKTTNIIQAAIPSVKTEPLQQQPPPPQPLQPPPQPLNPEPLVNNTTTPPNNYSYIVNLTPDQLETLKRNGQLTVNGQTIFMHRPNITNKDDKNITKSPKGKVPKKNQKNSFENKTAKTVLQEHLNIKNQNFIEQQINKVSTSLANQTIINSLQSPINKSFIQNHNINNQQIIISSHITSCTPSEAKQTSANSIYSQNPQNIICIQPNSTKIQTINKINETQLLMSQKQNVIKQTSNEQLIILEHKQNIPKDPVKSEPDVIFSNSGSQTTENKPQMQFINAIDPTSINSINSINSMNVEQFLTNLNINPQNLGQLISQKLSQELPSGIDPKIVNISQGATAGHIVAKIDISSNGSQQILSSGSSSGGLENPPVVTGGNTDTGSLVLPPLVSMGVKQETADGFNAAGTGQISSEPSQPQPQPSLPQIQQQIQPQLQPTPLQLHLPPQIHPPQQPPPPTITVQSQSQIIQSPVPPVQQPQQQQQQQLPTALIIGSSSVESVPSVTPGTVPTPTPDQSLPAPAGKVYQRVQTIQLTPQKQQLLKSVQLQIHALSARLQQKPGDGTTSSDQPEIHTALRHLFLEQQKILATGKVIPNITQPIATSISNNISCTMETVGTQSVPVTTASKTNGTFLTSLLQQPVVSHNQTQKVYYHHGNQIIAINPQLSTSFNTLPSSGCSVSTATATSISLPSLAPTMSTTSSSSTQTISSPAATVVIPAVANKLHNNIKKLIPIAQNLQTIPTIPNKVVTQPQLAPANQLTEVQAGKEVAMLQVQSGKEVQVMQQVTEPIKVAAVTQMSPSKRIVKPTFSKAQLIEQQLQTDQNGAMNPDITTPFSSKADAVKRLVRYHCYKQPVLSPKDLAKADEIFELTARHFIDKFRCMVTKYQALLLKESMREVQTSELMMIDRMFLAEEQQSFIKLQSDLKLQNELELCEPPSDTRPESSILAPDLPDVTTSQTFIKTEVTEARSERFEEETTTNTDFNIKCGLNYFSDESCDSNNFHPEFDEFIGLSSNEKSQEKVKNNQNECHRPKNPQMESYNTTKIIGNFEIEINNKGCNSQESFTKNFRQKVEKNENFTQKDEDYDEWLCIQRELGYFPENKSDGEHHHHHHHHQRASESTSEHSSVHIGSPADMKPGKMEKNAHKRSSSDRNCLESLKKYRVEKHNSKVKKTGSIIGEVKFEVRIEHKKVFPEQKQVKSEDCLPQKQMPIKRTQCFDYSSKNNPSDTSDIYTTKRAKQMAPDVQLPSTAYIKQEAEQAEDDGGGGGDVLCESETFDRSIDEQVQSAIDSILNLQQITSMTEKTDSQPDGNKSVLTSKRDELFPGSSPEDTLDEAVKSILS